MERGKETSREREKGDSNNSSVSSVLLKDIINLLDFTERLKNGRDQIALDMHEMEKLTLELTFMSTFFQLYYLVSDGFDAEMSSISDEVHGMVQSLSHQSEDEMLVKLNYHVVPRLLENIEICISSHHGSKASATMTEDQLADILDALLVNLHYLPKCCAELIFPLMTEYELLQKLCGKLRDFHLLKVNGSVEHETIEYVLPQFQLMAERVGHFCFLILYYQLDKIDEADELDDTNDIDETYERLEVSQVNCMLSHLLVEIIPVELEVMHICSTNLKSSNSTQVVGFIKLLLEASPIILTKYLTHLQGVITDRNIHVTIEFILIVLTDMPKDFIHRDKMFDLLVCVGALAREISIFVRNLEKYSMNVNKMNGTSCVSTDFLEKIGLLKRDLKQVYLKIPEPSELCFPMSDGPLFMDFLLRNLDDLLYSNAYSVALIKQEIELVKEDLEFIRSRFGNVEQKLNSDLWTRVLNVAYEVEHAINSILVRDHGLLQLIFLLPDTVKKIKLIKEEVLEKIFKNMSLIVANSPNKHVGSKSSEKLKRQIIVGFEDETKLIIRQLTSGQAERDVISIFGMPGSGKTTLAYKVYNDKSVTSHFDIRAWCTVDQDYDRKKIMQNIYNQVTSSEIEISKDFDVDDELRRKLYCQRYLIVLDDLWCTAAWDDLIIPFPEVANGSRIILTSRNKEVAFHGKCLSDPLNLRLLRLDESWELLEKRVFGKESCPGELKYVGEEIARKCEGLPLVLDLIGGVIARMVKEKALWLEVLHNLKSFKNEDEVMKVIELSYDHLSDHLKPCLLYLASYPKDKDIAISNLKILWSGEGLVKQNQMKSVEELVKVYMNELFSSSLVKVFDKRGGKDMTFRIHDLVHDFCLIKARKEKLFDFINSSAPPSSSSDDDDLKPRGMTVHYKHLVHTDENFVMFNPEKKNPYAKHLLSLMVYDVPYGKENHPSYNCHLRHLRLLKRLELPEIRLTDSLLNEIGMLVHLRCLKIQTNAKVLPLSFSNLWNLETLMVQNWESNCIVLSPSIWSLVKLRHVNVNNCSVFDSDIDKPVVLEEDSKLEQLSILHGLNLFCSEDTVDIFRKFPNLQSLTLNLREQGNCSEEQIFFPRMNILNELEEVCASFYSASQSSKPYIKHWFDFDFPTSLIKLELTSFDLTSDSLSRIARLPNLQNLSLQSAIIQGKEVTFEKLRFLKLYEVSFSEWQVLDEKTFPVLEELQIHWCHELNEIPDSFGDIDSLKSISLFGSRHLKRSALKIKKYVEEITGDDKLEVMDY